MSVLLRMVYRCGLVVHIHCNGDRICIHLRFEMMFLNFLGVLFVIILHSIFLEGDNVLLKKGKHKHFIQNSAFEHGSFFCSLIQNEGIMMRKIFGECLVFSEW